MENVIRIPPQKYIHVLDNNSNITRIEVGPSTFIRRENETVIFGPEKMVMLPPRTYCKINNPVLKNKKGELQFTEFGQVQNSLGDFEYRTAEGYPDPFPLYPGESIDGKVENLDIVPQNFSYRFTANRKFLDGDIEREAGEEWQRDGPFTYIPRVEEKIIEKVKAQVIKPNFALKLSASSNLVDSMGIKRKVGEQWLVRQQGAYLPKVYEVVVALIQGITLTDKNAIHLKALSDFTDVYKVKRVAGDEWLITNKDAQQHIVDVYEELVKVENAITLSSRQYCIIMNPKDKKTNLNKWGSKVLVKGETTFFLQPGELLQTGIQTIYVLAEDEALLLTAIEEFTDDTKTKRITGEKWLIYGPRDYIPQVEVEVKETRKSIPLDENEGIYVQNERTGELFAVKGTTYMLQAHEKLWTKELPVEVENLLEVAASGKSYVSPTVDAKGNLVYDNKVDSGVAKRVGHKVVTLKVPHNSACQVYDYKENRSRICFGPELVALEPNEQFTVLTLSGGKPKREGVIKTLCLSLGPDFMTDIVIVETSDHAQLSLTLSYNWYYVVEDQPSKLFSVRDFVGDTCKSIASRIRGCVSGVTFEDFHHHSSEKIREAVFGKDNEGNIKDQFKFDANGLVVTSVDIQNVEITDEITRKNLSKSINLAIEIATKNQENKALYTSLKIDQQAEGSLLRERLEAEAKSEESKIKFLRLQAESKILELKGVAVAKARAKTEGDLIKSQAMVNQARMRAQALKFTNDADVDQIKRRHDAEYENKKAEYDMEVQKIKEMSDIEVKKFKEVVSAIGKGTIVALARAGPETKAKLLGGLGLKGYLLTDGKNPLNLLNSANSMIGH